MPITPLCTPEVAVNLSGNAGIATPVRCKRWSCPVCHEANRRRVIRIARAGNPRALLTLTVSSKKYPDPAEAAQALKNSLRLLRLRLKRHPRLENFEFLAVFEKHQSGHPHLHLLIKGKFIPWKLLRKWWTKWTDSPIQDIRKISSRGNAALYCAKYIGKDLSSLPGCKRWWRSHGYSSSAADDYQDEKAAGQWGRLTANIARLRHAALVSGYEVENWGVEGFAFKPRPGRPEPPGFSFAIYGATGMNEKVRYGWGPQ